VETCLKVLKVDIIPVKDVETCLKVLKEDQISVKDVESCYLKEVIQNQIPIKDVETCLKVLKDDQIPVKDVETCLKVLKDDQIPVKDVESYLKIKKDIRIPVNNEKGIQDILVLVPSDVWRLIFSFLELPDVLRCELICLRIRKILIPYWKELFYNYHGKNLVKNVKKKGGRKKEKAIKSYTGTEYKERNRIFYTQEKQKLEQIQSLQISVENQLKIVLALIPKGKLTIEERHCKHPSLNWTKLDQIVGRWRITRRYYHIKCTDCSLNIQREVALI